ncbi:MAG TPA: glutamate-5-semialdehyde dehydrogenase [Opitutus sp.]|nr:glutamate-5-semialdehyde dehydrogenase [Opitutus sp.]
MRRSRQRCDLRQSGFLEAGGFTLQNRSKSRTAGSPKSPGRHNVSFRMSADLVQLVTSIAQRARDASLALATAPAPARNAALLRLADLLTSSADTLADANRQDLESPDSVHLTPAQRDRLTLTPARLAHLAASVRQVAALPDPVGELLEETIRPNGLVLRKVRVPIGVIGIVYEARPNVTIDCAVLCLKSGNAAILRGGKESFHTNMALAALVQQAIATSDLSTFNPQLSTGAVQLLPTTDRAALTTLLKLDTLVHCIIPRGGEGLIRFVAENSTIPVIKHFKGVCFVYVDRAADLAMAERILVNAKLQRPGVCNAAEQLLVHRDVAEKFLPLAARALSSQLSALGSQPSLQLRCDPASLAILRSQLSALSSQPSGLSTFNSQFSTALAPASASDYTTEFLDTILAVRVVDSLEAAIATINRDSSGHTDAIVTDDEPAARKFLAGVDSAVVVWNASTRFNDGFEFGLGAEIGISTDRLHARGPMGLRELCTYKWQVTGSGQIRT